MQQRKPMFSPSLKQEYFSYCRTYLRPQDVLSVQSTAIIHLKYIQQESQEKQQQKPLFLSKFSFIFNGEFDSSTAHVDGPLTIDYNGPPVPPSLLANPVELLRHYHDLPLTFWNSIDRFTIKSRPRISPPPVRIVYREPDSCERKILLTKLCKRRAIQLHQEQNTETIRLVMQKFTPRRLPFMRKRNQDTNLKGLHKPVCSSPLSMYSFTCIDKVSQEEKSVSSEKQDSAVTLTDNTVLSSDTKRKNGNWIKMLKIRDNLISQPHLSDNSLSKSPIKHPSSTSSKLVKEHCNSVIVQSKRTNQATQLVIHPASTLVSSLSSEKNEKVKTFRKSSERSIFTVNFKTLAVSFGKLFTN